jgi:hypothetical protein
MKLLKIQKMIGDFLHYRELIPLTTMNVKALFPALAGKGKGEPGHIKTLADHADGQKKEPEALQEAVKGLLDGQGVALVATESEAYKLEQLAPGIDPGLSQDERAKLIVKQHLMSIDMAYPGLIAQAWPNANKDTLISKATDDLLVPLRDLIEKRRESNRDFYRERIAATDERIQALQSERPDGRTKKALKEWEEIRQDLVKVLVANGGAQPPPPQGLPARRTRQAPGRYGPSYQYPEERKAKGKGKGKGTQSGPMEMDIDSEGVDPGDRTSQEADETEEEAVEAESRKQSLTSQIQLAENGRIVGFESAGRSPSPFGSQGMGAHTTAWTVHLDVIRRTILNQKVPDAITKLQALSNEARATRTKMEGAGFEVVDEQHQTNLKNSLGKLTSDIKAADKAAPQAQPILLQQAINSLLTYINYIPGATIVAADTGGKNEGRIRRQLLAHEQSSEKILTKKELRANLLGLLDLKGVGDDKKRLALLENHLKLVETAYPKSWADSGLGGGDPTAVLEEWVKTTGKKD